MRGWKHLVFVQVMHAEVAVDVSFDILDWAAWAPGLTTHDDWLAWARAPVPVVGADVPSLSELPPMVRRRVDKLGRLATHVALAVQGAERELPIIFASRHGDAPRAFDTQMEIARNMPLSPSGFAMSVHNAIAGQYSVIRGDTANISAVANSGFSIEAGLLEALTFAETSMLVVYEASPHAGIASRFPDVPADFAFAWKVKRGGPWQLRTCEVTPTARTTLPHSLDVLAFVLRGDRALRTADGVSGYEWSRS